MYAFAFSQLFPTEIDLIFISSLIFKMIRRKELRIDTEFFEDGYNDLNIPEAILISHNQSEEQMPMDNIEQEQYEYFLDHAGRQIENSHEFKNVAWQQDQVQEGYYSESKVAKQMQSANNLEKILSQILANNFIRCWNSLKSLLIFSHQTTQKSAEKLGEDQQETNINRRRYNIRSQISQATSHRRHNADLSPDLYEEGKRNLNVETFYSNGKSRDQSLTKKREVISHHQMGLTLDVIERKSKLLMRKSQSRKKQINRSNRFIHENHQDYNQNIQIQLKRNISVRGELQYSRAKILKQIAEKLKSSRQAHSLAKMQHSKSKADLQLHRKLNKIQKMMVQIHENQHASTIHRERSHHPLHKNETNHQENQEEEDEILMMSKFMEVLREIKDQIKQIKAENQSIIKLENQNRSQIARIAELRQISRKNQQKQRLEQTLRKNQQIKISEQINRSNKYHSSSVNYSNGVQYALPKINFETTKQINSYTSPPQINFGTSSGQASSYGIQQKSLIVPQNNQFLIPQGNQWQSQITTFGYPQPIYQPIINQNANNIPPINQFVQPKHNNLPHSPPSSVKCGCCGRQCACLIKK